MMNEGKSSIIYHNNQFLDPNPQRVSAIGSSMLIQQVKIANPRFKKLQKEQICTFSSNNI